MRKQKRVHRWFRKPERRALATRYLAALLLGLRGEELYGACGLHGVRYRAIWDFEYRLEKARLVSPGWATQASAPYIVTEKGERFLRGEI